MECAYCVAIMLIFFNVLIATHSKLCNIKFVPTKVHVMLRSYVMLTWMRDKRESM